MAKLLATQVGSGLITSDRVEENIAIMSDSGANGSRIKLYDTGTLLASAEAGLQFTNQPAGDRVEILSNSALDVQVATIWGTQTGAPTTLVSESITLTGVTFVSTVIADWDNILGVELASAAHGTVTFREASGDAAITTITVGLFRSGVVIPADTDDFYQSIVNAIGSAATTKYIGIVGTTILDVAQTEIITLAGAVLVPGTKVFKTVTKVLVGHLESTRTTTVWSGVRLEELVAAANDTEKGVRWGHKDPMSYKYGMYCSSTTADSVVDIYTVGSYGD